MLLICWVGATKNPHRTVVTGVQFWCLTFNDFSVPASQTMGTQFTGETTHPSMAISLTSMMMSFPESVQIWRSCRYNRPDPAQAGSVSDFRRTVGNVFTQISASDNTPSGQPGRRHARVKHLLPPPPPPGCPLAVRRCISRAGPLTQQAPSPGGGPAGRPA